MKTVPSKTLNDICEFIVDCLHNTAPIQDEGYPLIRTPNIGKGNLLLDDVQRVSHDTYKIWTRRATPQKNDLILAREAPAGNVALIRDGQVVCLGQRTVHLRPNPKQVNPYFLCIYLLSPKIQAKLLSGETGATSRHVNMKDIRKLAMDDLPELTIQNTTASIIESYSIFIDINRRRIQLLEEATRLLFREWFVYFKFPNHEKVKIVDRGGRKMPAEWDYLPFTKIKLFKKAPLGVPVFTDIRQYYQTSEIDGTSITGNGEEVDYENRPSRADIAPRINTVYFAKMKDTDKVLYFNKGNAYLLEKVLLSTGMVGFTTDEKYLGFLFGLLTSYEFVQYKNNFATGATQVSLNDASLKKIKVLLPALNLVELYSEIVNPLLEECSLLRSQNQKLTQARDLLLPRLMSGAIEV